MKFDSIVFADRAATAALSCLSRLASARDAGQTALILPLGDAQGSAVIEARGLGQVRRVDEVELENDLRSDQPWRERIAVLVRRFGPTHVMAPIGLLGAAQSIDYFSVLRTALTVDKGRDLLFFEERPQCFVREAVGIRLAGLGARLPPATVLRSGRKYATFAIRLVTGFGIPPIFGGIKDRWRLSKVVRPVFADAREWDPLRALGPKLQPVFEAWREKDTDELFALAAGLGESGGFGSRKAFRRRLAGHAASAGKRAPFERYWLSLPEAEHVEATADSY